MASDNRSGGARVAMPFVVAFVANFLAWPQSMTNMGRLRSGQLVVFDTPMAVGFVLGFLFIPYANSIILTSLLGIALQRSERGGLAFVKAIPWLAIVLAIVQMIGWVMMSTTPFGSLVAPAYFVVGGVAAVVGIAGGHFLLLQWKAKNDS